MFAFEDTWLANPRFRQALDIRVRKWLGGHRGLKGDAPTHVAAASVAKLCTDAERFWKGQQWFWCTTAIVILTELVFGAEEGGTLQWAGWSGQISRNAVLHPAHHSPASAGKPHVERLIEWLKDYGGDERPLAQKLRASWAYLAHREIAVFSLRKLDSAGKEYCKILGL